MKHGWKMKRLGDLSELITKGTTPTSVGYDFVDKGINFVKVESIDESGKFIPTKLARITKECYSALKRSQLKKGDILFSIAGALGRTALVTDDILPANTNQALSIIRLKESKDVLLDFILIALKTGIVFEQIQKFKGGVAQQNLSLAQVQSFQIPLPPAFEQKQIVKILDEVFEKTTKAKENAEKNLQNARELFESHLQSIFANPGEDWKTQSLGEVCKEIFAGGDVPKDSSSKTKTDKYKIPIFANGATNKGLYGYTDQAKVFEPSITVSARGTIGYSEIRHDPYFPVVRLIVLIPSQEVVTLPFLKYVVGTINFKNSGTSIPQLTVPMIKGYKFCLPQIVDQKRIVAKLDCLSAEIKKLEAIYQQKLVDLEELKKSVLHKAFNGELAGACS